ncbi:MAG: response regulator [Deltaproteobacteria bacterium]|nr:response regulator [Deltaproteobacteria bacterium]
MAADADRPPVVLVVEDNEDNRELVIKVLRHRGFAVVGLETGREALERLAEIRPDVILMDINLPGMDGYEVTSRIRATPEFAAVPIIALTAHAMRGDEAKSLAAGCDAYIPKPINVRTLADQISAVIAAGPRSAS